MKQKINYLKSSIIFVVLASQVAWGCKKDDNTNGSINDPIPTVGVNFNPNLTYGNVNDIDGNVYKTIKIDTHVWMAENLKTTRYRNGEQIPNVKDAAEWYNLTNSAYCDYNNDINNSKVYGRLYNYYTILDSRNVAPLGWHVATDYEWSELIYYTENHILGLREAGTAHWKGSSEYQTNNSGFTALPGGGRLISWQKANYSLQGEFGYWWCSDNPAYPVVYEYWWAYGTSRTIENPKRGYSIRCVKD